MSAAAKSAKKTAKSLTGLAIDEYRKTLPDGGKSFHEWIGQGQNLELAQKACDSAANAIAAALQVGKMSPYLEQVFARCAEICAGEDRRITSMREHLVDQAKVAYAMGQGPAPLSQLIAALDRYLDLCSEAIGRKTR